MRSDDYLAHDGTGLAALVSAHEVSPSELLETAVELRERVNPTVNAITWCLDDLARAAIDEGLPAGPFHGVPYLVKDQYQQIKGTVTTVSCRLFAENVAAFDTTMVTRLKAAGLVIFGKTNTPELAISATTEPAMFGPTRNPWGLRHIVGGSSGGAAAAVAGGIVPMAQASDSGGSIRIPASCCGVVGLKPTRGRNPLGPRLFENAGGVTCTHAITRTIRDTATLLDVTSGPELGDPYVCHPHRGSFASEIGQDPGRLRVAVASAPYNGAALHSDVRAGLEATATLLATLGHHVDEVAWPIDAQTIDSLPGVVVSTNVARMLDRAAATRGKPLSQHEVEPLTWSFVERGRAISGAEYAQAIDGFQIAARSASQFHESWDVLLSPTLTKPPLELGTLVAESADDVERAWREFEDFSPFTSTANITGQPSMTLPLARSGSGLPIGMLFTAALGREDLLLRLGAQLESAQPWQQVAPPETLASR